MIIENEFLLMLKKWLFLEFHPTVLSKSYRSIQLAHSKIYFLIALEHKYKRKTKHE